MYLMQINLSILYYYLTFTFSVKNIITMHGKTNSENDRCINMSTIFLVEKEKFSSLLLNRKTGMLKRRDEYDLSIC